MHYIGAVRLYIYTVSQHYGKLREQKHALFISANTVLSCPGIVIFSIWITVDVNIGMDSLPASEFNVSGPSSDSGHSHDRHHIKHDDFDAHFLHGLGPKLWTSDDNSEFVTEGTNSNMMTTLHQC